MGKDKIINRYFHYLMRLYPPTASNEEELVDIFLCLLLISFFN
jgi:hypothetical protein